MNDQILNGYLQDFASQQGLEHLDESALFGRFVAFCVISKQAGSPTSTEALDVDGGQDTGLDAIAVLINDRVVGDKEEVDYFKDTGRLDVEFVFIQSKRSPKFDGGDIGKFLFGVKNFFSMTPKVTSSIEIEAFREIKDYIYQNSIHLKRSPICRLYYATTGKWLDDAYLTGRIEHDRQELLKAELFSDVAFAALDADRLKAIYRELRHRVEKEVLFEKHTILPSIDRAEEAYLGILPASEFLKLIVDDEGEIQKSLFYDNVRDFQGSNPVNSEIAESLANPSTSGGFVILNNGVTIVAKSIAKVGAKFRISDYQIVNGCQTSHVIHLNRARLGGNVYVPVKLIATSDAELANQVIKATNRQTEVKLEAFESLGPFHRTLEEYYASFGKEADKRLYYERRSKQYANAPIRPTSIITLAAQAKAFLGMYLNEPHSTHRYYGELLETNRDRLFVQSHSAVPYYAAGLALSLAESFFRTGELSRKWRRYKHHLLMLLRLSVNNQVMPPLEGRKAEEHAKKLCEVLWNRPNSLGVLLECQSLLQSRLQEFSGDRTQADRLRAFTNLLLPGKKPRPQGTVRYWNMDRGFGFAAADDGRDVFAHHTSIRETMIRYLREGNRVEFDVIETDRGPQARDVRVLTS